MEVICIEERALYLLLEKVLEHVKCKMITEESKWISAAEAMQKFAINSKTTSRQFRNEGRTKFTQPKQKTYLYNVQLIEEYLERKTKKAF